MQIIETKEIQKTMAEKIQELELEIKELKKVRNRSSHRRFSLKKVSWEIWQNSQENTCARVSFFNKVAGLSISETSRDLLALQLDFKGHLKYSN